MKYLVQCTAAHDRNNSEFKVFDSGKGVLVERINVYLPSVDMLHGAKTTSPGLIELNQ